MRFKDLTGKTFGLWSVLKVDHRSEKDGKYYYTCQCQCGTVSVIRSTSLTSGNSKSCGCNIPRGEEHSHFKHGLSEERLYYIFCNIIQRCRNPKTDHYDRYGGRGIDIAQEFVNDFLLFKAELGPEPDTVNKWTVERIKNDLGYIPGNIKWATKDTQARNKGKFKNNKSGKTGVYYYDFDNSRSWVALWNESGKQRSKFFNIRKYGYDEAFRLACEFRDKTIQRLREEGYDYSDTHGE